MKRDAVPPRVKFQEVRMSCPASGWPVEVVKSARLDREAAKQLQCAAVAGTATGACMLSVNSSTRVPVTTSPVDLRGSFNRLYSVVVEQLNGDPLSG